MPPAEGGQDRIGKFILKRDRSRFKSGHRPHLRTRAETAGETVRL